MGKSIRRVGLNIPKIRESLEEVKRQFSEINKQLSVKRDDLDDMVLENMVDAYSYLDGLLKNGENIFSRRGLPQMLELNHIVLCGTDREKRAEYHRHIEETRQRFYRNVDPYIRWYEKHKDSPPAKVAAETYVGILSTPQLYNEGNHRTGSLIASWILAKGGYPPFVLNVDNAIAYFEPSSEIKFTDKREIGGSIRLPKYKRAFRKFLEERISDAYIIRKL